MVAQVALDEGVARIALQAGRVFQVAGVGEFVEVDNGLDGLGQPIEYKVAANEADAAGDKIILKFNILELTMKNRFRLLKINSIYPN